MPDTNAATDTQIVPILEPGEYSQFMLRSPAEIMPVMRGLRDRVSQISVFFNEGQDTLLTVLVAVANDHLIIDISPDDETNRKAVAAKKHFCVTTLDKVRVQFILRGFTLVTYEGRPAFRSVLPDEVLRLQRREYYRLIAPIARPLKSLMPLPLPDGGQFLHEANVFDISGGGLGISAPPVHVPFDTGMQIPSCRIDLPEIGIVTCTLKVCSVFDVTLKSGARIKRAGCEFVRLPGPMMTLIQRYIIKVERERKARESGLSF